MMKAFYEDKNVMAGVMIPICIISQEHRYLIAGSIVS